MSPMAGPEVAEAAYARLGPSAPTVPELGAEIRVGSLLRPVPAAPKDVAGFADAFYSLFWEIDAGLLAVPPTVETAFGVLPVDRAKRFERFHELERTARTAGALEGLQAMRLLAAAHVLRRHLELLEQRWRDLPPQLTRALVKVEQLAARLACGFLIKQHAIVRREQKRYVTPDPQMRGTDMKLEYRTLVAIASRLTTNREDNEVDELLRNATVTRVLCMGYTAATVLDAFVTLRWTSKPWRQDVATDFDPEVWTLLAKADRAMNESAGRAAAAIEAHRAEVVKAAAEHPLVLILDLAKLDTGTAAVLVNEAVAEHRRVVTDLAEGVREPVIAAASPADRATVGALIELLVAAPDESIWKLPIFWSRATDRLPPHEARMVKAAMVRAASASEDVANTLWFLPHEAALSLAPVLGSAGIAVAFLDAVKNAKNEFDRYQQLTRLMKASVDPGLLLADPTNAPSIVPVIFACLSLKVA